MKEFETQSLTVIIKGIETTISLARQGDIWTLSGKGFGADGITPEDVFKGALGIIDGKKAIRALGIENIDDKRR